MQKNLRACLKSSNEDGNEGKRENLILFFNKNKIKSKSEQ